MSIFISFSISNAQYEDIRRQVNRVCMGFHMSNAAAWAIYARLRAEFGCKNITQLSQHHYTEAIAMIRTMEPSVDRFKSVVVDLEKRFFREVLKAGEDFDPQAFEQQLEAQVMPALT